MESLSAERQEMVQTLMSFTGIEDPEFAREFLQDNSWQLEAAVSAYLVMTEDGGGADGTAQPSSSPRAAPAPSAPARPDPAPAPPVVQRLVDDMPGVDGPAQESFRNFAAEGMAVAQSSAAAPEKLDYLFPPPADIMFHGNFDALRKAAEDEEKYCLINIQKRQEFSSQMLNRDTWPDDTVRTIMGFRFLFWQQEYESQAGAQYLSCYPSHALPVVDIVDPITGGLLERIEEYQTAEQMVERLTRFIDSHQWGKMGVSRAPSVPWHSAARVLKNAQHTRHPRPCFKGCGSAASEPASAPLRASEASPDNLYHEEVERARMCAAADRFQSRRFRCTECAR